MTGTRTAEQSITTEQQEWLDGLRALTDWFEQHPRRIPPAHYSYEVPLFPGGKRELAQLTRELGKVEKIHSGDLFRVRRHFGPHKIAGVTMRNEVCKRVVTGMKQIPEEIVPAHEEEIVEWVCDEPLLASVKS